MITNLNKYSHHKTKYLRVNVILTSVKLSKSVFNSKITKLIANPMLTNSRTISVPSKIRKVFIFCLFQKSPRHLTEFAKSYPDFLYKTEIENVYSLLQCKVVIFGLVPFLRNLTFHVNIRVN